MCIHRTHQANWIARRRRNGRGFAGSLSLKGSDPGSSGTGRKGLNVVSTGRRSRRLRPVLDGGRFDLDPPVDGDRLPEGPGAHAHLPAYAVIRAVLAGHVHVNRVTAGGDGVAKVVLAVPGD